MSDQLWTLPYPGQGSHTLQYPANDFAEEAGIIAASSISDFCKFCFEFSKPSRSLSVSMLRRFWSINAVVNFHLRSWTKKLGDGGCESVRHQRPHKNWAHWGALAHSRAGFGRCLRSAKCISGRFASCNPPWVQLWRFTGTLSFKNFLISQHGPSLSGLGQCANFDLLGSRLRDRHEWVMLLHMCFVIVAMVRLVHVERMWEAQEGFRIWPYLAVSPTLNSLCRASLRERDT